MSHLSPFIVSIKFQALAYTIRYYYLFAPSKRRSIIIWVFRERYSLPIKIGDRYARPGAGRRARTRNMPTNREMESIKYESCLHLGERERERKREKKSRRRLAISRRDFSSPLFRLEHETLEREKSGNEWIAMLNRQEGGGWNGDQQRTSRAESEGEGRGEGSLYDDDRDHVHHDHHRHDHHHDHDHEKIWGESTG